jgi:hypothetical protein
MKAALRAGRSARGDDGVTIEPLHLAHAFPIRKLSLAQMLEQSMTRVAYRMRRYGSATFGRVEGHEPPALPLEV